MEILNGFQEFEHYQEKILKWAQDRNILAGSTPKDQFHKLIQECAELSESLCKDNDPIDDYGDIMVVLIIMMAQSGVAVSDALAYAYDEIKDRKGFMHNGVFQKEE